MQVTSGNIVALIGLTALSLASNMAMAQSCVDLDGDGYGWDGNQSCQIAKTAQCVDTDGDGWGWNGFASCQVMQVMPGGVTTNECVDTDGDGWGWDGTASCRISIEMIAGDSGDSTTTAECVDTDGDGWGWNGTESCVADTAFAFFSPFDTPEIITNNSFSDTVDTTFSLRPVVDFDGVDRVFDGFIVRHLTGRDSLIGIENSGTPIPQVLTTAHMLGQIPDEIRSAVAGVYFLQDFSAPALRVLADESIILTLGQNWANGNQADGLLEETLFFYMAKAALTQIDLRQYEATIDTDGITLIDPQEGYDILEIAAATRLYMWESVWGFSLTMAQLTAVVNLIPAQYDFLDQAIMIQGR